MFIIMVRGTPPAIHSFAGAVRFRTEERYPVRPFAIRMKAV